MNTNKVSLYLYAFFRSITAKFRKSYNQGLNYSTLNTYILLSVRCIVADAGHDSKQYILSTKLYKSSYVPKSRLKSMILRRKVNVALRKSKTLGKDVFATNKEFLTIWGRFLNYKERQKHLSLPILSKNKVLHKSLPLAKYVSLINTQGYADNITYSKRRGLPLNKSSTLSTSFFLESSFFHKRGELAYNITEKERRIKEDKAEAVKRKKERRLAKERKLAAEIKAAAMQKAKEERELREAKKAEAVRQAKLAKNPGLTLPAVVSTKKEEKDTANSPKPKKKDISKFFI